MNFLEKLLDGAAVEWKPLGEVAKYEQPTKYLVQSANYSDEFETPVLTAGKTFILGYTDELNGIYRASKTPVIIFDDFTTANKWVDFDFKAKSSAMKMITSINDSKFILKYVYYWLNTLPSELIDGDHKRQWISNFCNKKIPIPPLEIQAEIVRILDTFTALTAELTAELTDRKKQYNYYRDRLLSFEKGEVEWKKLGEVYQFSSGLSKSADQFGFGSPFLSYKAVFKNISIPSELTELVNTSAVEQGRYSIRKGDVFVTRTSESLDELGMSCAALEDYPMATFNGFTKRLRPKDLAQIDPKFSAFFFRSTLFREQIARIAVLSTRVSLNASILANIKMPVPSLEEQARIVAILDKFDTLTTSISEGLPREIALRQKQYEYYRDLLLTFPKPEEVELHLNIMEKSHG